MIFLDQKAAFPSLRQDYLMFVLEQLGVPSHILAAIRSLYSKNRAHIKLFGMTDEFIDIGRGIRQGCPLSGTLWVLGFDLSLIHI